MGAHAVVCPAVGDEAPAQSRVAVIAVDTGIFVALADRSDAWHQAAVRRMTIRPGRAMQIRWCHRSLLPRG